MRHNPAQPALQTVRFRKPNSGRYRADAENKPAQKPARSGRKPLPVADARTQAMREANRKSYQKRGSKWSRLTDEQKKARLEATRLWKQRNKDRRTESGYKDAKKTAVDKKVSPGLSAFYQALKEKHKGFENFRLEKSIKPPIYLTHQRGPITGGKK